MTLFNYLKDLELFIDPDTHTLGSVHLQRIPKKQMDALERGTVHAMIDLFESTRQDGVVRVKEGEIILFQLPDALDENAAINNALTGKDVKDLALPDSSLMWLWFNLLSSHANAASPKFQVTGMTALSSSTLVFDSFDLRGNMLEPHEDYDFSLFLRAVIPFDVRYANVL